MLSYIKDKAKSFIVTLRVSILSIFATLFVITIFTLLSLFYLHIDEIVQRAALLLMGRASYSISQEIEYELDPPEAAAELTASLIQAKVIDMDNQNENEMLGYLVNLLKKLPLSSGMHWGDTQGGFVFAHREEDGSITTEVIDKKQAPWTDTYVFRDKNGKEIKRIVSKNIQFDPRERPWFQLAMHSKHTVWTDVIKYAIHPTYLGVSVSSPVFHENGEPWGVFAIDIPLDYLSRYIAQQKIGKNGEIIIVNKEGLLVAAPSLIKTQAISSNTEHLMDIHRLSKPWIAKAFDMYLHTNKSIFKFQDKKVTYLAAFRPISILANDRWLIGIVVPASDFTRNIHHIEFSSVLIFLIIFFVGVLAMSNLVSRIINPIKKLVSETKKIQDFNLEGSTRITSHIKEVNELSDSIYGMKMGLRSFRKYVPAGLVRQLIATNEDARTGGTKRDLVIFFSDIKNFTSITEKVDSNELVQQIGEYLETFTKVITSHRGTIDKFIGDSIMAFWGAPLAVHEPCQHAARAALAGMKLLDQLNKQWLRENKPIFATRIGIHFGEAIVGNIGSSERLNYTALGDTVNIASRLVTANKLYGTSILVSETVYQQIKDVFVLRLVDKVKLRGKIASTAIYELMAEDKESLAFDIEVYVTIFEKAFKSYQQQRWQEAIELFSQCLQIYPDDILASFFIKRCRHLGSRPPAAEWDGVWQLK